MPAATRLPDTFIRFLPVFGEPVQLAGKRLPQLEGNRCGELVVQVDRVHELAVYVELELAGGAVTDPYRFRVAVAAQMLEHDLVKIGVAVYAVEDVQAFVGRRLVAALFQPVHEGCGLVGEPERHQSVCGERGVADPGIAVVPVSDAAEFLRQGCGRRGDQSPGRPVNEQFENERRTVHHLPPASVVPAAAQPRLPVGEGAVEQAVRLAFHERADGRVPFQDDVRGFTGVKRECRGDAVIVGDKRHAGA